ncbi:hypothetical protein BJ912DRAFT_951515 [Pholiota molesta]|nr:hypothetical protein BJ912DRAFT_951515 [Pholiota molesta]
METAGYPAEVASATGIPVTSTTSNQPKRRNPRQARPQDGTPQPPSAAQPRPPRRPRPPQNPTDASAPTAGSSNPTRDGSQSRNARRKQTPTSTSADGTTAPQPRRDGNRRKANFGAGLTQSDATENQTAPVNQPAKKRITKPSPHPDSKPSETPSKPAATSSKPQGKGRAKNLPQGDDLTSILIRDLSTPPYPDCPICFSAIRPEQAIWSCSPSISIVTSSDAQVPQYCWTSFHVKCIRSWAEKSVKEVADAWRARGESDKKGDWRCPGCQAKRETVPSGYWCFCHSTSEPKPLRLSTPHSCGNSCSRPRESGCGHPCPLQCHPGPCPPCQVTTRLECYCPKKSVLTFRCGIDARSGTRNLSCGKICQRTLNCGKHTCNKVCHAGECDKCDVTETVKCYCGKEGKTVTCGEGREIQCFVEGETPWIGRFTCDNVCDRPFDCGKHKCQKPCHPPSSQPAVCPRSPSQITHCPCGKHTVAPSPSADASQYTFPARLDCPDPIPTCGSVCAKPHPACSHPCTAKCHTGPCPPCTVQIVRPCRCGATTKSLPCYAVLQASAAGVAETELLCDRPCAVLRACGGGQCFVETPYAIGMSCLISVF